MYMEGYVGVLRAVICTLQVHHPVFQYFKQLIHLNRMQFSNLIYEKYAPMSFGYSTYFGLRYSGNSHSTSSLVYRVVHRADKRVCNTPFIKSYSCCINLNEFCILPEGAIENLFCLLQYQSCSSRLPDSGGAVYYHMLRIWAAYCSS